MKKSAEQYKAQFPLWCEAHGLPKPSEEVAVVPERKWRFDYFFEWEGKRVAVECEGGVWSGGRHTRGGGYVGDMEKYMAAASVGVVVLRVTPEGLASEKLRQTLRGLLYGEARPDWSLPKKVRIKKEG